MSITVNWDEVPEEYEWFAIDSITLKGHVYTIEPEVQETELYWCFKGDTGDFELWDYTGVVEDWKETLQQRPVKPVAPQEEKSFEMSLQRVGELTNLQITGKLSKEQIIKIMEVIYE